MKMFKKLKKLIMGAAAVSMSALLMFPGAAVRAESNDNNGLGFIDMNKDATLSVYYYFDGHGDIPEYGKMEGVNTRVYKLASISEKGEFTVLSPYDTLGLDIKDMYSIADQDKWNNIIAEASKCIAANNIQPSYTGTSDSEGFTKLGKVEKGLYYGVSDPVKKEGIQYKYWDFLSVVPGPNNLTENIGNSAWDGTWKNAQYDVIAVPKREASRIEDDPEQFVVHKQWIDDGKDRPESITINIYCDGSLYESIALSNGNNWQYSWEYEKGHNFIVEEDLSSDKYTATVSRTDNSFTVVNTKKPEQPEQPKKPEKPEKPQKHDNPKTPDKTDNPPEEPDNSVEPDENPGVLGAIRDFIGELPEVLGARRLPQTGQLWWPVPILVILGILLVILGFRSEKHRK
ncbi:Cna B-type domain-containing protein [Butyrivibrio sp. AE3004]|uniref:Cna B-type domain-containing protein n=1 Tax=Butyrivibrio sp. AE3004 TaxID=1506994 RepID=UPI00049406D4|nr:Cna B-type domain-containing protein [Butyrivibrio sp. AE3004]